MRLHHRGKGLFVLALCGLLSGEAAQATRYVWQKSPNPTPPYTNWATAAHVLQNAVDAAWVGEEILVTNGVYATGGKAVHGTLTNRVAVVKPVTLRSVNGPAFTVIQGRQVSESITGDGAVRCVYLDQGAVLSGFTLTNGATRSRWVYDSDNAARFQQNGGGCFGPGTLTNCILINNAAARDGGGADGATLYDCTITGNSAGDDGGGVDESKLHRCVLKDNSAGERGGGASESVLYSSVLHNNRARNQGGGANKCVLWNCTIIRNAGSKGGGISKCTAYNTIVYHNEAALDPNWVNSTLHQSCTTPLPAGGVGNTASDPLLASESHLSAVSPCVAAGSAEYAIGLDIDGQPWVDPPSMGADQLVSGGAIGPLTVGIKTRFTRVASGYSVRFEAHIEGQTTASHWDFGDGTIVSNRLTFAHAWKTPGVYTVRLIAFNDAYPEGISATTTVQVLGRVPVYYVNPANPRPVFPFTNWATAATAIQPAIAAGSVAGRVVLVTNGIYSKGGVSVWGQMTNRIALTNGVVVRSVNGPAYTFLRGAPAPNGTNGNGAIRCAYVEEGSILDGFTLTNGHTRKVGNDSREQGGGGAWCERSAIVTNCIFIGNKAQRDGGGANGGIFYGCAFRNNRAEDEGGGVDDAILHHCLLKGNSAKKGGAASEAILAGCTITRNWADHDGGGAHWSTLEDCTISENSSQNGGGVVESLVTRCGLTGNQATYGGGSSRSRLFSCWLTGNRAKEGGGSVSGSLDNCTLTGNVAQNSGGGAYWSELYNCIIYHNTAMGSNHNYYEGTLNHCATLPAPNSGVGNITADPQLASLSHLSATSPCRGAGGADKVTGLDIDGEAWRNPPSIGCDEYRNGTINGPVTVVIKASGTNVVQGVPLDLTAWISGRVTASIWDFGDGTVLSNRPCASHVWSTPGNYRVVLRAYNESHPEGVSTSLTVRVVDLPVHYVSANSAHPVPPYRTWATAARTIQAAVDATTMRGALVLVSNGVYAVGGRKVQDTTTNRVAVNKPVVVRSVNGPAVTVIEGYSLAGVTNGKAAIRCCYLTNWAVLSGFTLTNGGTYTEQNGGGVWCESRYAVVTNCLITGNHADIGAGAYSGTLNNCTITGNYASYSAGGAYSSTLNQCTVTSNQAIWGGGASLSTLNQCKVVGNVARDGGGAYYCTANNCTFTANQASGVGGGAYAGTFNNCIIYYNTARYSGMDVCDSIVNFCCTTAWKESSVGIIRSEPGFVNSAAGDLRLQASSPCINAGQNSYVTSQTDLDDNPRIVGGTVDIGAYEFQAPASCISYAWLQQYRLPVNGSADTTDPDGDTSNNWEEWLAGTDPMDGESCLRISAIAPGPPVRLYIIGSSNRLYTLYAASSINSSSIPNTNWTTVPGLSDFKSNSRDFWLTDTNAATAPRFYRIGVSLP